MSEHDVTKSSNPDVQALLVVITGLAQRVELLTAEVAAMRGELAALPDQFVVPGPDGQIPQVVQRLSPFVAGPSDAFGVGVAGESAVTGLSGHGGEGGTVSALQPLASLDQAEEPPQDEHGDDDYPF